LSNAWGLFYPAIEFVLLALFLELVALSTPHATPGPPSGCPASSRSNSIVATPCLDPSLSATTCYGRMLGNFLSVQTLRQFLGKSSMCLPTGSGSFLSIERTCRCLFSLPWGLMCFEATCSALCHTFMSSAGTYCMWVLSILPMQ
jgi:hypothetical protein